MKQAWSDLKSFLTIFMTLCMGYILIFGVEVNQPAFALFSTAYGSMITFYFTKKAKDVDKEEATVELKTRGGDNESE